MGPARNTVREMVDSQLLSVKKLDCTKDGDGKAYLCDVETDIKVKMMGEEHE